MKTFTVISFFAVLTWGVNPSVLRQFETVTPALAINEYDFRPVDVCWESLNCSIDQIEAMSITDRLEFMKYMGTRRLGPLKCNEQFGALEGVLTFFIRKDLATRGTWLSIVNAAAVEAVQRGAAISLGLSKETGDNPGTMKWVDYFTQRKAGRLTSRAGHDLAWAAAEQAAIDHGIRRADTAPGIPKPSGRILRWQQFTRIYRTTMQYRRTILWLIRTAFSFSTPSIAVTAEAFMDWVTDVTDATSSGFLADIAWNLSIIGLSSGEDPAADSEAIMKIATEFWEAFQQKDQPWADANECRATARHDVE
ncbi:hypothetical protein AJ80_03159 [Polytolypa hystricis UAMH7299]|uniref:Uncharacterized protein n=1 Tax=Polytolypa hystricis (strain UAMH7299) TaxID=1447883 RepID=A0A2B7YKA7_POLH7|nr:hypothetical protein AJ80_03159 [Polytolypa hystricis UAMH7299]